MFTVTDEEKAVAAQIDGLRETIKAKQEELRQISRGGSWNATEEEKEAQEQSVQVIRDEIATLEQQAQALVNSDTAILYASKSAINEIIAEKIQFPPTVLLSLAEEAVATLDGESGQRATTLLKGLGLRIVSIFNDPDYQAARAENTVGRYRALINAGMDEDLAARVLVAESGRPLLPPITFKS